MELKASPVIDTHTHPTVQPAANDVSILYTIAADCYRVFRRYLQMYPENSEDYIEYLVSIDR
jgi:hypothetical protein